jgi:hypothetical protein
MLEGANPDGVLSKGFANSTGVSVGSLRHVRLTLPPFEELLEQLLFVPIE